MVAAYQYTWIGSDGGHNPTRACKALVVLADKSLALISFETRQWANGLYKQVGEVCVHKQMAEVLKLADMSLTDGDGCFGLCGGRMNKMLLDSMKAHHVGSLEEQEMLEEPLWRNLPSEEYVGERFAWPSMHLHDGFPKESLNGICQLLRQDCQDLHSAPHHLHHVSELFLHHGDQDKDMITQVVESISHEEPGAERDPEVAQLQVDMNWASHVEQRLQGCHEPLTEREDTSEESIWLLRYASHPQEFKDALLEGLPLRACRNALDAAHRPCILPDSGAKIFIRPEQWDAVMPWLEGRSLRPYHVIVSACFEHLIHECLMAIPYRRRPKLKQPEHVGRSAIQTNPEETEDVFDELNARWIAELTPLRTFLCVVRSVRSANSVCQSTAQHYGATINPRRYEFAD
jgi:hypothetical protein